MNNSGGITIEHQAHNPNVVTAIHMKLFLYFYTEKRMLIPQQNPKYTFGHQLVVCALCIKFRKKLPCQQKTKATTQCFLPQCFQHLHSQRQESQFTVQFTV